MKEKLKVLVISYGAAAIFVAAGIIFTSAAGVEGYRTSQDNEYRRAMAQLVSSMGAVDEALQKGCFAEGSGMAGKVSAQLMSAAQSASTALSILPLDTYALEEVAAFLSQLEEYATVKGSLACVGKGFDDKDRENFSQLQKVTGALVPTLGEMYHHLSQGGMSIRGRLAEAGLVSDASDTYLEDEILALLKDFPKTPKLEYAGTLSDNYDHSYAAVSGLSEVTEEDALQVAKNLTEDQNLTVSGLSQGDLPSYYFSGETEDGTVTVAVTQQGGLPELYLREYTAGEETLSEEEIKQAAQKFLQQSGYDHLREERAVLEDGYMKITYVYTDDNAAHLAAAVNVTVAMDTGTVVAMDASEYLRNHGKEQNVQENVLSAEEAADIAVPKGLKVINRELTWFTGETGTTTLCWRFTCKNSADEKCVIYADGSNGQQVEIRTESGNMSDM